MTEATYLGYLRDLIIRLSAPGDTPTLRVIENDDVVTLTVECIYSGDAIGLIDHDELMEQLQAKKPAIAFDEYKIPKTDDGFTGIGTRPTKAFYEGEFVERKLRLTIRCTEAVPS